jgi:hypothetical protein
LEPSILVIGGVKIKNKSDKTLDSGASYPIIVRFCDTKEACLFWCLGKSFNFMSYLEVKKKLSKKFPKATIVLVERNYLPERFKAIVDGKVFVF